MPSTPSYAFGGGGGSPQRSPPSAGGYSPLGSAGSYGSLHGALHGGGCGGSPYGQGSSPSGGSPLPPRGGGVARSPQAAAGWAARPLPMSPREAPEGTYYQVAQAATPLTDLSL